jgi:predicted esterase YcpF (UPF0227 family)
MYNYAILNEVLDITYLDINNKTQNKRITINKKTIQDNNNINALTKNLESYLTIIYDNNSYLKQNFKQYYDYIIKFNMEQECKLKYVTKYCYLDYYID